MPLRFITPNLRFYPPALKHFIIDDLSQPKFNQISLNPYPFNYDFIYSFISCLMEKLNHQFLVINDLLIEIFEESPYVITINFDNNRITIQHEESDRLIFYVNNKCISSILFQENDKHNHKTYRSISDFIEYHCQRICDTTAKLNKYLEETQRSDFSAPHHYI